MKKIFLLLPVIALFFSCAAQEMQITVENPTDFERVNETVEITLADVESKFGKIAEPVLDLTDSKGNSYVYQITSDGKFIFQVNLKAKESETFKIKKGTAKEPFEVKTYARYIQERKDDFAWENDRVAFRIYGPALMPIDGPSNGIDAWYKRTNNLVIDKWYKNDLAGVASYHNDNGEGQDDYKVGRSLGAGAMAPYVNDSLWLNENYVSHELTDNGPIRSAFKVTYADLDVDGKKYGETRTFSIDAGSQLTKVIQEYKGVSGKFTVAAGLAKRGDSDSIVSKGNFVIYAEPYSPKVHNVYLAMVFPNGYNEVFVDTYKVKKTEFSHVLAVCEYKENTPLTYYTGYGWSKFGFSTLQDFEKYVEIFSASLKNPLKVTY